MKKKNTIRKFAGICLVAMMAVAGVGKYAKADTVPLIVRGKDRVFYYLTGVTEMSKTRGTSYTEEDGSDKCYCSVSATFRWQGSSGEILYSNGNGAGGMHGASVSMYYNDDRTAVSSGVGNHMGEAIAGGYEKVTSTGIWKE